MRQGQQAVLIVMLVSILLDRQQHAPDVPKELTLALLAKASAKHALPRFLEVRH